MCSKNLYVIWSDGDEHRYLINKEYYKAFEEALEMLDDVDGFATFENALDDLLDSVGAISVDDTIV